MEGLAYKMCDERGPKVVKLIWEPIEPRSGMAKAEKHGNQALDRRDEPIRQRHGMASSVVPKDAVRNAREGGTGLPNGSSVGVEEGVHSRRVVRELASGKRHGA